MSFWWLSKITADTETSIVEYLSKHRNSFNIMIDDLGNMKTDSVSRRPVGLIKRDLGRNSFENTTRVHSSAGQSSSAEWARILSLLVRTKEPTTGHQSATAKRRSESWFGIRVFDGSNRDVSEATSVISIGDERKPLTAAKGQLESAVELPLVRLLLNDQIKSRN